MLQFAVDGVPERLTVTPRRLLIAGYTGRDQAAVARHIAELRAHGIPAPSRTPALYALTPDRLTTAARLCVVGSQTSGEVEFVLVCVGRELYIGVGSDHTDRALERLSVARAKQVCAKPISAQLWRWADVRDRWDRCVLRSWMDGALYQEGSVAELLPPEAVLALVEQRVGADLDQAVVYCGTLPVVGGELRCGRHFEAVLSDPVGGRMLRCAYQVDVVDDLD
ncbi:MAG TPA: DUF2848 family protein [Chloroflexota bacterium]|nr:DUF2848 family protein [Chloroflexota bacterium]HZU05757.1 DUF2848 family protein [Chloroflexota bacterium]